MQQPRLDVIIFWINAFLFHVEAGWSRARISCIKAEKIGVSNRGNECPHDWWIVIESAPSMWPSTGCVCTSPNPPPSPHLASDSRVERTIWIILHRYSDGFLPKKVLAEPPTCTACFFMPDVFAKSIQNLQLPFPFLVSQTFCACECVYAESLTRPSSGCVQFWQGHFVEAKRCSIMHRMCPSIGCVRAPITSSACPSTA